MSEFLQEPKAIKVWLDKMGIENATIRYDNERDSMVVDVAGSVDLDKKLGDLTQLPVQFGHVDGDFHCYSNQLTSLNGAPQTVGGSFFCFSNNLTSLEGAPQIVGVDFDTSSNQLTSLKGAPQTVGGDFYCTINPIKNLSGIGEIGGDCVRIPSDLPSFGIAEKGSYDGELKGHDYLEVVGKKNIEAYIIASLEAAKSITAEPTLASIHIAQTTNEPNPLQTALINKNWAGFCDLIDDPATRGLYTERTKEALILCSFDPRLSDNDRTMARITFDYTSNVLAFEQERSMSGPDR
jgi:hypothetical protein